MGLIRVSDHAEKLIREHSHGRTITATVDAILAGSVAPDGTEMWKGQQASEDDLRDYLDKKFDELKSLIEDTTVDRVSNVGPIRSAAPGTVKVYVPWDVARELFFEFLPDNAPEYIGSASEALRQADGEFQVFIMDGRLWTEDNYGTKAPILNISPRVQQFLESHK